MSVEVKVPSLGESIVEATVGRWLKGQGDPIAEGDALVELETDKVNMEVQAPGSGTLESIVKGEGETVGIGDVLGVIGSNGAGTAPQPVSPSESTPPPGAPPTLESSEASEPADGRNSRSTPTARRMAEERGIDVSQIKGTGPSGRVTRDDVTAYLDRGVAPQVSPPQPASGPPVPAVAVAPLPRAEIEEVGAGDRREERVRMSRRRQTIARRLVEAQHDAAMLTTFNEIDMSAVIDTRKRRRDAFKERYGIGLGFMSFFTKAVVGALKEFPRLNAEIQGNEMVLKHYYDIGIAVGAEGGLVVPVVRDADRLTFAQIEKTIGDMAQRARSGQLTLEELQGGTFTISNGGIYGSLLSTPILNAPQVGILGMHKIQERPMALNGEVVIRPMMYVALSYDHRIVDGNEAVRFLVRVKEMVEDPERLLIEG